jgi:hypothetical protein
MKTLNDRVNGLQKTESDKSNTRQEQGDYGTSEEQARVPGDDQIALSEVGWGESSLFLFTTRVDSS